MSIAWPHAKAADTPHTLLDARQIALAIVHAELINASAKRLLVFGKWSGSVDEVRGAIGLDIQVRAALEPKDWEELILSGETFEVIWLVGIDTLLEDPLAQLLIKAVASTNGAPGARIVFVACAVGRVIAALRWATVQAQRYPKIERALVVATLTDEPPVPPPVRAVEPLV